MSDLHIGILHAVGPLEQAVIKTESERASQQVVLEGEDYPLMARHSLASRLVMTGVRHKPMIIAHQPQKPPFWSWA